MIQAIHLGVPDDLLTSDAAALELRVLHAAHGVQLVGPYSRFYWSHPGPLYFYLALPFYEAFGERGAALNLFALLTNAASAVGIVLTSRRLLGDVFAWSIAAALALLELVALPFLPASMWNPVTPVLPLIFLSLLTVNVALGAVAWLPFCAFLASAIVQTHIGFGPAVAALALVLAWALSRRSLRARIPVLTWAVLLICWALPLYEGITAHPSNITRLLKFFTRANPDTHPWPGVLALVRDQLALLPAAFVRLLRGPAIGGGLSTAIALVLIAAAVVALFYGWRRGNRPLHILSIVALAEMCAAVLGVRSIRGEIHDYLVYWLAAPGFLALAVTLAWVSPIASGWQSVTVSIAAAIVIVIATIAPIGRWSVYGEKDPAAEQVARETEHFLAAGKVREPVVRVASADAWPTTAALIVYLQKHGIPVRVEPAWTFMFGSNLEDRGGDHARLFIGSSYFGERARAERLMPVAEFGDASVYFEPAHLLDEQRLPPPSLVEAVGVIDDPRRIVDGVVPPDGSSWNTSLTARLQSTSSTLTLTVPKANVAGLFMSADGNDLYAVRCADRNLSWEIGVPQADAGMNGMHTMRLYTNELAGCPSITVAPAAGDGMFSIGEVGFLRQ